MTAERSLRMALVCAVSAAACSSAALPAPPRAGAAAGSGSVVEANNAAPTSAQPIAVVNPGPSAAASRGLSGCGPGRYAGTYGDGSLFGGPLEFNLIASAHKPAMAAPCEEFCPEVVIGGEGGEFSGSWLGFEGRAKVVGGLDCRTGEFRAQLVDGHYGADPNAPDAIPFLSGDLSGTFQGKFRAAPAPSIDGSFTLMAAAPSEAMFTLTLSKP